MSAGEGPEPLGPTQAGVAFDRVPVRLGDWRPPEPYNQPHLEPEGSIREVEHKVIADVSVVQHVGRSPESFTLRGDAWTNDIAELRRLKGDIVELRHPIHSGDVLVRSVSATSESAWDNIDGDKRWVYTYIVELVGVT